MCERMEGWEGGSTTFGISRRQHARILSPKPNVMMDGNNNNIRMRESALHLPALCNMF